MTSKRILRIPSAPRLLALVGAMMLGASANASNVSAEGDSAIELPRPFIRESGERSLPEFVFQELLKDGSLKEMGFVDLRGRPIVAMSWATWCGVCAKDLPELETLAVTLAKEPGSDPDKRVLVAALSIDDLAPAKVKADLDRRGISELRPFLDTDKMFFLTTSGVGVPSAIIADADGKIVARAQGSVNWQDPAVIAFLRSLEK